MTINDLSTRIFRPIKTSLPFAPETDILPLLL
jgi:hypothetical protein